MEYKYLTLPLIDKTIFFRIEIKKYHAYFAHGIDFQDYQIIISDIDIWEKMINFEDKYGGFFLILNEKKELKIYDNIKKELIEIDKNNDIREISYFYYDKEYNGLSLNDVIKEIIFKNILDL